MTKYDIVKPCPICGEICYFLNGKTNAGIVYIKTKRKTIALYHEKCIKREQSKLMKG